MKLHDCDVCGSNESKPLWVAQNYISMGDSPPDICQNCGFVYQRSRRSSAEIAEDWKRLYEKKIYDPTWPGVKARLYYVAEWIDQNIGMRNKTLLDIGGGTGTFCGFADRFGAEARYFDPATEDSNLAEDFKPSHVVDIVTILWTLENCGDCNAMIAKARECLKPDGHLVVATGSRILVPFRKPMSSYFSTEPQDLHAFRWSADSLYRIASKNMFGNPTFNDYEQNDVLLMAMKPTEKAWWSEPHPKHTAEAVENHFIDWYRMFP